MNGKKKYWEGALLKQRQIQYKAFHASKYLSKIHAKGIPYILCYVVIITNLEKI